MRGEVARVTPDFALTDAEIRALGERGWFLRDAVLGPGVAMGVHDAVEALAAAGRLRPAGLGRGTAYRVDGAVRGDAIAWIAPDEAPPELAALWAAFAALRDALNREAYLGIDRMEVQAARYPGRGAAYRRHRDAFPAPPGGRPNRRVTAIYYANPGWRPEDGGALRLHLGEGPLDVAPVLDRLLVFLSERVEHEVLPARAPRCAVTAWFRARDPLGG
jgi:SM-20-related protein